MQEQSRGFFYWVGHLSAWILAIGMVLTLPFAIAARDFGAVIFSQRRVQSILQSRLVDSGTLNRMLVDSLLGEEGIGSGDAWLRRATEHLSDPERHEILDLILPPGWVEEQLAAGTGAIFIWLETDQPAPDLFLDVQPLKARLLGETLDQVVEVFVDSWPSCTPEQVENLQSAFDEGGELPPFVCEPPEPLRQFIVELATRGLAVEAAQIPDRMPFLERGVADQQVLQSTKRSLRSTQALLASFWLVPLAPLGLIMSLKIRGSEDMGRWWGVPLLSAGVATLLLNLLMRASQGNLVDGLLQDFDAPGSVLHELLELIIRAAASQALRLMLLHALILVTVGGALWFLFAQRKRTGYGNSLSTSVHPRAAPERLPADEDRLRAVSPPPVPPLDDPHTEDEEGPPSGIFG